MDLHPNLPSIAVTNINFCPMALEWYRIAGRRLKSGAPVPAAPQLIASRSYSVRGILIGLADKVAVTI